MILLPHSVRYVFLSATVPNAVQFAEWIAQACHVEMACVPRVILPTSLKSLLLCSPREQLHGQPCHVVYTEYRPTPLLQYIFGAGSEGAQKKRAEKSRKEPKRADEKSRRESAE